LSRSQELKKNEIDGIFLVPVNPKGVKILQARFKLGREITTSPLNHPR